MKRRSRTTGQSTVATFDFAARREFVTGATHRKELRRRDAQARLLEKRKEERRLLRAERREKIREHINHVNRSQQLAAAAANPNLKAVRLLPAEAPEGASVSPWHIASCVSLSLGGFPQPREPEAEASPAASTDSGLPSSRPPLRSSLQVKESKAEVSPLPSGEAEVKSYGKKRHVGAPGRCRGGKHKPQKKRHKSRKPQKKRNGR
ncbi:uncharacterized protein LOC34619852 [Cyclospora cayetanensis]|uniref:Uncharacterized protein LOC34619852 n=1 Tax=Cyclospora cayetanensis TaxID=88456 RepID=A0A6P6RU44_9EIME|nr:uncharacterized protein LOC34619852 [Cyclospora cayetanensis]